MEQDVPCHPLLPPRSLLVNSDVKLWKVMRHMRRVQPVQSTPSMHVAWPRRTSRQGLLKDKE